MNIEDIEVGMNVIISDNISITDRRHSSCSDMHRIKGKVVKVKELKHNSVMIAGFRWAPEDLEEAKAKPIKPQIFHYDPLHLET